MRNQPQLPLDEFITLLRLQRLIARRKWADAYIVADELIAIRAKSASPPLSHHTDRPIREVMK